MNSYSDLHDLSLKTFIMDSKDWATESPDHVSLSKYTIWTQLFLVESGGHKGNSLALFLRAAALKREHSGASRFIFWSFADSPPERDPLDTYRKHYETDSSQFDPYSFHGVGAPTDGHFQKWLKQKSSGNSMVVPEWDLPLLADYADDFLHLLNQLRSLSQEFDQAFPPAPDSEKQGNSMYRLLNHTFFFSLANKLDSLAKKILESAAHKHHEKPIDLLLQAFEGIGLVTQKTYSSKVVQKKKSTGFRKFTNDQESDG